MKLNFELVPDSCWYSNLRSQLPKEVWDRIRKKAYARAGGKCMLCGAPTARLEAHEQCREKEACEHYLKVNGCTYAEYRNALGQANETHRERSRREWRLDVSELPKFL